MARCSRQRVECAGPSRRFGFGVPAALGRRLACRGDGKAVLQARALQTLARLLIHRSEATGFLPRDSVKNLFFTASQPLASAHLVVPVREAGGQRTCPAWPSSLPCRACWLEQGTEGAGWSPRKLGRRSMRINPPIVRRAPRCTARSRGAYPAPSPGRARKLCDPRSANPGLRP